ncbi:MAG TPA: hypothetical protein VNX68_17930, partial [Nitrosopumilaceae archaeon]|nr:hypothetical protein [Nitrosopumilaceae archaeon]
MLKTYQILQLFISLLLFYSELKAVTLVSGNQDKKCLYSDTTIIKVRQNWTGTSWENNERRISAYDKNGNLTSVLSQLFNTNGWSNSVKWMHNYDTKGNKTQSLRQDWYNGKWGNANMYVFSYDTNNNQIKDESKSWNGNSWVNSTEFTSTYTNKGKILVFFRKDWADTAWTSSRYTYTYDAKGNEISRLFEQLIEKNWNKVSLETSSYDNKGN